MRMTKDISNAIELSFKLEILNLREGQPRPGTGFGLSPSVARSRHTLLCLASKYGSKLKLAVAHLALT